jgi:hypothetical protein
MTVAKLDQDFNIVWRLTSGSSGGFIGNKVIVDRKGNVYVAGMVSSWSIFGLQLRNKSCCSWRDFLIKVSPQGKLLWVKAGLGENLVSESYSLAFDKDGNIIFVGSMMYTGTYGSTTLSTNYACLQ